MRPNYAVAVLGALCAVLVGCGGSTTPEQPPDSDTPTSDVSDVSDQPAPTAEEQQRPPRPPEEDPPGVPGSPIDYDSTLLGAGPDVAKAEIEGVLESQCGASRCGVKVVVSGSGECITAIGPDPVSPGGTVTITVQSCEQPEEPSEPESEAPSEESPPTSGG